MFEHPVCGVELRPPERTDPSTVTPQWARMFKEVERVEQG